MKKKPKAVKAPTLIKVTVYFETAEQLENVKKAAAKVQRRLSPNLSGYVAQAALERVERDLAGAQ